MMWNFWCCIGNHDNQVIVYGGFDIFGIIVRKIGEARTRIGEQTNLILLDVFVVIVGERQQKREICNKWEDWHIWQC